jgi:hypothetical protein
MPLPRGNFRYHPQSICLLVFAALTTPVASACWSIYGVESTENLICNPQAEVSNCCSLSDVYYSNGLCGSVQEAHNDTLQAPFWIGGCTEQSFEDPVCAVAPKCSCCCPALSVQKAKMIPNKGGLASIDGNVRTFASIACDAEA